MLIPKLTTENKLKSSMRWQGPVRGIQRGARDASSAITGGGGEKTKSSGLSYRESSRSD